MNVFNGVQHEKNITYGNERFAKARNRICTEARATGEFDDVIAFEPKDVSAEVQQGPLWNEKRGGGYWTWKPDIIWQTLNKVNAGDIVVYADAGCEVVAGREWKRYWGILERKDLIFQRIYQICRNWTRQSIRESFNLKRAVEPCPDSSILTQRSRGAEKL